MVARPGPGGADPLRGRVRHRPGAGVVGAARRGAGRVLGGPAAGRVHVRARRAAEAVRQAEARDRAADDDQCRRRGHPRLRGGGRRAGVPVLDRRGPGGQGDGPRPRRPARAAQARAGDRDRAARRCLGGGPGQGDRRRRHAAGPSG